VKVISGIYRGRNIVTDKNAEFRPTKNIVREAIFNSLESGKFSSESCISDKLVLDLCCGTGSLGLEALSRGAEFACFIDNSPRHLQYIRQTIVNLEIEDKCKIVCLNAENLPNAQMQFDLVFLDPPYHDNLVHGSLKNLLKMNWLKENCLIIIEVDKKFKFTMQDSFSVLDDRKYNNTRILYLQKKSLG
jgi:16S rRNA (guanine966-N2)-methyltransferase